MNGHNMVYFLHAFCHLCKKADTKSCLTVKQPASVGSTLLSLASSRVWFDEHEANFNCNVMIMWPLENNLLHEW